VTWISPTCAELTLTLDEHYIDCPAFFSINVGAISEGMRICSPGPAKVTLSLEPRKAVYQIEFLTAKTFRERARAVVRILAGQKYLAEQLIAQQREIAGNLAALRESEQRYR